MAGWDRKEQKISSLQVQNQWLNKKWYRKKKIIWGVDYPTPAQGGVFLEKSRWICFFSQQQLEVDIVGDWTLDYRTSLCLLQSICGPTGRCLCRNRGALHSKAPDAPDTHADCPEKIILHANYITVIYVPWHPKVVRACVKDFFKKTFHNEKSTFFLITSEATAPTKY